MYNSSSVYLSMKRESKNKTFTIWLEEIWEEIEIQFFGIAGAIIFFVLVYFIFHPIWMRPLFDIFSHIKLSALSILNTMESISPISIIPAFSPGPQITIFDLVGSCLNHFLEDL